MPPVAQRWPERSLEDRFFDHVLIQDPGCWLWTGYIDPHGYGRFTVKAGTKTAQLAHRVSYELIIGPIPEGMTLDHICRNRACVAPVHLQPVTLAENKARGSSPAAINARKTHCYRGHEYNEQNTYFHPSGRQRQCRVCRRKGSA